MGLSEEDQRRLEAGEKWIATPSKMDKFDHIRWSKWAVAMSRGEGRVPGGDPVKFLKLCKDGGYDSTVWAYFLFEIKWLFSIALLRFEDGSRDAYHSHAFHCVSWVLRGALEEEILGDDIHWHVPRFLPFITRRTTFHKVTSVGRSWVLTLRGPWAKSRQEYLPAEDRVVTLTHGRKELP